MARVAELEPWLTKRELAKRLGCSTRWLNYRMTEGLPHALIAGHVKFRQSEAEGWLEAHDHIERRGDSQ